MRGIGRRLRAVAGAAALGAVSLAVLAAPASAQMRERVYEKLSKAEAHAEAQEFSKAVEKLDEVKKVKDLSPYELAQLYTAYGFVYYSQDNLAKAIDSYESVLEQPGLPEALDSGTRYTLAQLYFQAEQYQECVDRTTEWLQNSTNPGSTPYILLGQSYYQLKQYRKAVAPVEEAISIARAQGKPVQESWYLLLRIFHYELKDYRQVVNVLHRLVAEYPKVEYWKQLGAIYGEMNQPEKQLAVYDVAYQQGALVTEAEQLLLGQLLIQAGAPYRGARIIRSGIENGVIEASAANYRLLSQAWTLAKEDQDAIAALTAAAGLSSDGELDARLAQSHLNLGEWDKAASAARAALGKGVDDADQVQVLLGMALFEMDRYDDAKAAFRKAQKAPGSERAASQWIAYIDREQERLAALNVNAAGP